MSKFTRPRHQFVMRILSLLSPAFLEDARCYFGGGTRIVMALGEYRESADIDLLCADRAGYRALRSTVTQNSLGRIAKGKIALAREVIADRYGIRTFIEIAEQKIKFEIIHEARIDISGGRHGEFPVPALDPVSCFAEKFLANADRWSDESTLNRDIVDLAFMVAGWSSADADGGRKTAAQAYGKAVNESVRKAVKKLHDHKQYLRRCIAGLRVSDPRTLGRGLEKLAAMRVRADRVIGQNGSG